MNYLISQTAMRLRSFIGGSFCLMGILGGEFAILARKLPWVTRFPWIFSARGRTIFMSIAVSWLMLPSSALITYSGLVAYYSFIGNANDVSGRENHGTVSGAYLVADRFGYRNSAFRFDGMDDSIQIPDDASLHLTRAISLATWVFPTARKTQEIVVKGSHVNGPSAAPYGLALSGTGEIVFSLRPSLQFAQITKRGYRLNQWLFVVGTYDGRTMKLYVNGTLENSRAISGELNENSLPLLIGTRLNLPADTFQGDIDEVRIYNRALTAAEIRMLYEE